MWSRARKLIAGRKNHKTHSYAQRKTFSTAKHSVQSQSLFVIYTANLGQMPSIPGVSKTNQP
jgi:hypothetical protein